MVDTAEFAGFARRIIRAYGRRVANGDEVDLAEMLDVADEMRAAIDAAVAGLRSQGHSWAYIAKAANVSRQAAWERWQWVDPTEPDETYAGDREHRAMT